MKQNPWDKLGLPEYKETERLKSKELTSEEKKILVEMEEYKEEIYNKKNLFKKASLRLHIKKQELNNIKLPKQVKFGKEEEEDKLQDELRAVLVRLKKLPALDFQTGITLIVGENGYGKSTLAKAIYFVLKLEEQIQSNKEYAITVEAFQRAESRAREYVFNPNESYVYGIVFLTQSGLAPEIAKVIVLEDAQFLRVEEYADCAAVIGEKIALEQKHMFEDRDAVKNGFRGWDYHRSSRQTIDECLQNLKSGDAFCGTHKKLKKPKILFIDQPEEGASPKRQRQIEKELSEIAPEGSIVIVPTNSLVLYESDLPRIDLEYPERGIFRPSEYLYFK
ncbi:MAG: AAA family ATPase [Parcubacteria group bacterium]|jgi:predicted ATPase